MTMLTVAKKTRLISSKNLRNRATAVDVQSGDFLS